MTWQEESEARDQAAKVIYETYPAWFPPMFRRYGLEIGLGWISLFKQLCDTIKNTKEVPDNFHFLQVKEKFGDIRIYTANPSKEIQDLIWQYENSSSSICEVCGEFGHKYSTPTGWLKTLCSTHQAEREKKNG